MALVLILFLVIKYKMRGKESLERFHLFVSSKENRAKLPLEYIERTYKLTDFGLKTFINGSRLIVVKCNFKFELTLTYTCIPSNYALKQRFPTFFCCSRTTTFGSTTC